MIKSLASLAQDLAALELAHAKLTDAWNEVLKNMLVKEYRIHEPCIRIIEEQLKIIHGLITNSKSISIAPAKPRIVASLKTTGELDQAYVAEYERKSKEQIDTIERENAALDAIIAMAHRPDIAEEYDRRSREEIAAAEAFDSTERSEF